MKKALIRQFRPRHGSYPVTTVLFGITLSLFVTGILGTFYLYADSLTHLLRRNLAIQVYLQNDLDSQINANLVTLFNAAPYVGKDVNGKPNINYVSKEQAGQDFAAETGEDFISFLGSNPLHDAYLLGVASDYSTESQLLEVKGKLEKQPGVFQVSYVKNLISVVNENINRTIFVLTAFASVLLVASALLIYNTIRLALFSQRFLIRSMQLVGATNWFIIKPFIIRAAQQGVISGILASLLLLLSIQYATLQVPELLLLQDNIKLGALCLFLLAIGASLGSIGSYISVNSYLKLKLDELYK